MADPVTLADVIALLTPSGGADTVTSAELRAAVRWLAAQRLVPTDIKTAAYTAQLGERVLCNPTGGAFPVTLPSAVGKKGHRVGVKNVSDSANAITVEGTVDGIVDPTIAAPRGGMTLESDDSEWMQV